MTEEQYTKLLKLTLQNRQLIDVVFGVANDFACLINHSLVRCSHDSCKESATVEHVDLKLRMCDWHAAEAIVRSRINVQGRLLAEDAIIWARIADEECWVDLPNAHRIRRLQIYVHELSKNDEPSPPISIEDFH